MIATTTLTTTKTTTTTTMSTCITTNTIVSFVVVVLTSVGYYHYMKMKKLKEKLPFHDIPYTIPNPHWLYGHLLQFGSDPISGLKNICYNYSGGIQRVCTFYIFNTPVFTSLHYDIVQRILKFSSERSSNYQVRKHFYKLFGKQSIIMLNGKLWKQNRDIFTRAFNNNNNNYVQETIIQVAIRVQQTIQNMIIANINTTSDFNNNNSFIQIDLDTLCRMACLDIFGLAALGYDFGCTKKDGKLLQKSDIFERIGFMQSELTRRCFLERLNIFAQFYWIPTPTNIKLSNVNTAFHSTIKDIIRKRRAEQQQQQNQQQQQQQQQHKSDLLSDAMHGCQSFAELSDDYLVDFLSTAIFGGYDTTALGTTYTIYMLAIHPVIQNECAKEALNAFTSSDDDNNDDDSKCNKMDKLTYITGCFLEAIRCIPPTVQTGRTLHRDLQIELDGRMVTLPKGTRCMFSFYWIHHCDINFPKPDEYIPERWVQRRKNNNNNRWEERTKENDYNNNESSSIPIGNRQAHFAFSAGARNCVGQSFALQMVPTIVAVLLQKFKFELADPNYQLKLERYGTSQAPVGGIPVKITFR